LQFWFHHLLGIPPFFLFFVFEFFLVDMPVGFKTFGQAALFYIPLANGAEYVLLIIDFLLSPFVCPSIQYTFYSFH
jgi:hypothetical protein